MIINFNIDGFNALSSNTDPTDKISESIIEKMTEKIMSFLLNFKFIFLINIKYNIKIIKKIKLLEKNVFSLELILRKKLKPKTEIKLYSKFNQSFFINFITSI